MPASRRDTVALLSPLDNALCSTVVPTVKRIIVHKVESADSRIFSCFLSNIIEFLIIIVILIAAVLLVVSVRSHIVGAMPVKLIAVLINRLAVTIDNIFLAVLIYADILAGVVSDICLNRMASAVNFLLTR